MTAIEDDAFRDALVSGAADHPLTVRDYCLSQGTSLAVEHHDRAARYPSGRAIWGTDEPAPTIRTGSRSPLLPGPPFAPSRCHDRSESESVL